MNSARRSYEAHVLLLPLGAAAVRAQEAMVGRGLDGIMVVRGATSSAGVTTHVPGFDLVRLNQRGWRPEAEQVSFAEAATDADIVVLLATDLADVPPGLCPAAADTARGNGALVVALVIGSGNWDTPAGKSAMAALREAADMLVVVRGIGLAAPFLDVLRGGSREPAMAL